MVRLPQAVFLLVLVCSNLVNFAPSFVPLLLLMAVVRQPFTAALLFLPLAMLILTIFISGVTLLFATFTVFFRDVRHLAEVGLQMLMYLSPVVYDLEMLGQHDTWWFRAFRVFLQVNPLIYLLRLVRNPVYYGRLLPLNGIALTSAGALAVTVFVFSSFNRPPPRAIRTSFSSAPS